jgi:isoleucyl-tRNA synthetase
MDIWIVSRVHQLINDIQKHMDGYDIASAAKLIFPFVEDASNWYVRRSRRRFWKSGDDEDKNNAYVTLHYVLVQLSKVLAPFTPFLAEELFQKLTGEESVHLVDWPLAGKINLFVLDEMEKVREYVTFGLGVRAKERIKVRQPLAKLEIPVMGEHVDFVEILSEELNVKEIALGKEFAIDLEISEALKKEGLVRELIRHIQNARKDAGLNIDDRISLIVSTENNEMNSAIDYYETMIKDETLASEILDNGNREYSTEIKIDELRITISLQKI